MKSHIVKIRKKEDRKNERYNIPLKLQCQCLPKKSVFREMTAENISGGGMMLRADSLFEKRSRFKTLLYFPDETMPLNVLSEVVWCKKREDNCYNIGIKHINIAPKDRDRFVLLFCELMINSLVTV